MDVLHTAIWVSDLDAQLEFYDTVLDLELSRQFTGDDGVRNTYVKGEGPAEIQFKSRPDAPVTVEPSGIDHLAVKVPDVDAAIETAVEAFDSEVTGGPKILEDKSIRIAFFTDPEGYVVEVIEDR